MEIQTREGMPGSGVAHACAEVAKLGECFSARTHARTHAHTHTHTHTHTPHTHASNGLGISYNVQWFTLHWLTLSTLLMMVEGPKQLSNVGVLTQ